jgi:hypothetical protein
MQKVRVPINSFQFGEVSDSLKMRTDTPVYAQSAQSLENMVVMSEGSVKKRYGLKHIYDYGLVYKASDETGVADDDGIVTEFTNAGETSFTLDGAFVSDGVASFDGAARFITFYNDNNASPGNPIPSVLNLTLTITGTDIYGFPQTETIDLDDDIASYTSTKSFKTVSSVSINTAPTNFNLKVGVTATLDYLNKPNQSHLFKFIFDENEEYIISVEHQRVRCFRLLSDGTISLVSTLTADVDSATLPFDQDYLQEYTYAQYGDVMFIAHPLFMTRMLTRTSLTSFEISTYAFDTRADSNVVYQPYSRYQAQGVTLDPSATSGTGVTLTTSENYWDITGTQSGGNYPDSKHIGVVVRYGGNEIEVKSVQSATQATGDVVDELKIRLSVLNPLRTIDGSATVEVTHLSHGFGGGETIVIEEASAVGGINTGNLNGTRTVGEIIDENTYTFTAGGNASSSEDGGGYVKIVCHAPTDDWDEQAYSAKRGYPAAVTFHENRLCFGGTLAEPDTIWMSQIGEFFNFDEGEAADSEAITLTAATGDVNEIRYLISNRDLQVFTASGELYIPTYLNQAITPTNAQIRKQTPYGSSFVQPVSIDGATVFVQQNGRVVREYLYSDSEDAYTATAISTIASHLITDPKCLTVVHSGFGLPDSYAALTLSNGDMALFSSNRAERRAAWTRVTTSGSFCSVVGIEDRLFANIWYDNQLHLCEFDQEIGLDKFVSGAISANKLNVSAAFADGDVIQVIHSDGTYIGDKTVDSSDEIDLTGYTGTVYAGLKFTVKIETNEIDASMGAGPATGTKRGITNVVVDFKDTDSAKVNSSKLIESNTFSGKKEFRVLGYSRSPTVIIEQDDPLPMQVNGIVAELIT